MAINGEKFELTDIDRKTINSFWTKTNFGEEEKLDFVISLYEMDPYEAEFQVWWMGDVLKWVDALAHYLWFDLRHDKDWTIDLGPSLKKPEGRRNANITLLESDINNSMAKLEVPLSEYEYSILWQVFRPYIGREIYCRNLWENLGARFSSVLWTMELLRRMENMEAFLKKGLAEESLDIDVEALESKVSCEYPKPPLVFRRRSDEDMSNQWFPLWNWWERFHVLVCEEKKDQVLFQLPEKVFKDESQEESEGVAEEALLSLYRQFLNVLGGLEFPESLHIGGEMFRVIVRVFRKDYGENGKRQDR